MTVLLIDGVGHIREWEIPVMVSTLLAPVPVPFAVRADGSSAVAPVQLPIAVFELSDGLSYPPVYRWVRLLS